MLRNFSPYVLTRETAVRLTLTLSRRGSLTLRDLRDRYRFWPYEVKAAETSGFVRIETRKRRTGRPSRVAVLLVNGVSRADFCSLPRRCELPRGLSIREEIFLVHFMFKRGTGFFGGGKHCGSAADAYRKTYGVHRKLMPGSVRSAGARLIRQPHMRAAILLDRRLTHGGGRRLWPEDIHSNGQAWLCLLWTLERKYNQSWPVNVREAIRNAHTFAEARAGLPAFASV